MNLTYRQPFVYARRSNEYFTSRGVKDRGLYTALYEFWYDPYPYAISFGVYYSTFFSHDAFQCVKGLFVHDYCAFKTGEIKTMNLFNGNMPSFT